MPFTYHSVKTSWTSTEHYPVIACCPAFCVPFGEDLRSFRGTLTSHRLLPCLLRTIRRRTQGLRRKTKPSSLAALPVPYRREKNSRTSEAYLPVSACCTASREPAAEVHWDFGGKLNRHRLQPCA